MAVKDKLQTSATNSLVNQPITELPKHGYIRANELLNFVPFGRTRLWQFSKDTNNAFPKPYKISDNITAWACDEVHAYFDGIKACNDDQYSEA